MREVLVAMALALLAGCAGPPSPAPAPPPPPPPPMMAGAPEPVGGGAPTEIMGAAGRGVKYVETTWTADAAPGPHRGHVSAAHAAPAPSSPPAASASCTFAGQSLPGVDAATCQALNAKLLATQACFAFPKSVTMVLNTPHEVQASLNAAGDCATARADISTGDASDAAITSKPLAIALDVYAHLDADAALPWTRGPRSAPPDPAMPGDPDAYNILGGSPVWRWTVVPNQPTRPGHYLHLRLLTGVILHMPDGTTREISNATMPATVTVTVNHIAQVRGWLDVVKDWAGAIAAALLALAGVIYAVIRIRNAERALVSAKGGDGGEDTPSGG